MNVVSTDFHRTILQDLQVQHHIDLHHTVNSTVLYQSLSYDNCNSCHRRRRVTTLLNFWFINAAATALQKRLCWQQYGIASATTSDEVVIASSILSSLLSPIQSLIFNLRYGQASPIYDCCRHTTTTVTAHYSIHQQLLRSIFIDTALQASIVSYRERYQQSSIASPHQDNRIFNQLISLYQAW